MSRYLNISGQTFNRLTAVKYLYTDKNRQAVWLWKCDCGEMIKRTGNTVKRDLTKSCGCLNRELIKARTYLNFSGRGHTNETKQIIRDKLKGRKRTLAAIRKSADAIKGKKQSLEHRIAESNGWTKELRPKWAKLHGGTKCPFYKDGKWKERANEREVAKSLPEYKEWRRNVFQRDNYTCQFCHEKGGKLVADHIEPWCKKVEKRYTLSNGRTLCEKCHRQTETFGGKTKLQSLGFLT